MSRNEAVEYLKTSFFRDRINEIEPLLVPAIEISHSRKRIGQSRFGGEPLLPADFEWPQGDERPLDFLCQIFLSEATVHDAEKKLPNRGVLFFFYDTEDQPGGYDPKHIGGWRVVFVKKEEECREPMEADGDAEEFGIRYMRFKPRLSIPFATIIGWREQDDFDDDQDDAFCDALDELVENFAPLPNHQLLGNPQPIQDDMRLLCELVSQGIYCGDEVDLSNRKIKRLIPKADDWVLLLQLDFDEDGPGFEWGDSGILYFMLRKQDLAARNFSRVMAVLQSH